MPTFTPGQSLVIGRMTPQTITGTVLPFPATYSPQAGQAAQLRTISYLGVPSVTVPSSAMAPPISATPQLPILNTRGLYQPLGASAPPPPPMAGPSVPLSALHPGAGGLPAALAAVMPPVDASPDLSPVGAAFGVPVGSIVTDAAPVGLGTGGTAAVGGFSWTPILMLGGAGVLAYFLFRKRAS